MDEPVPRRYLDALAAQAQGRPRALLALARHASGEQALELLRRALALAPHDGALRAEARAVMSAHVPAWHFRIVRDAARNTAYDTAIRRAVTPDSLVLEIGAGTGLLAMMAARAGARRVVTCEANPTIAALARQVIAANGYAGRVTVIASHSTRLDPQTDVGGPADVLVSEIISNDLLGQGVLDTLADAKARLLAADATVIPAEGRVRVALAEDRQWRFVHMPASLEFDLSAFDGFGAPVREASVSDPSFRLRSEPADLFAFDLAAASAPLSATVQRRLTSAGGVVNAIAQWIDLRLDQEVRYENVPGPSAISCWAVRLHRLDAPLETHAADSVMVGGRYERNSLQLWIDG